MTKKAYRKLVLSLLMIGIIAVMVIAGCTPKTPTPTPAPAPAPTPQYPAMSLRIAHGNPQPSQYSVSAQLLVDKLKQKTGGQIVFTEYPRAVLGDERGNIEACKIGTLDACITSTGAVAGFIKETTAFDYPYLFRDSSHAYKVLDGPIGSSVLGKFLTQDLVGIAWMQNGWRAISNNVRPIRTVEDLKGLKMRVMQTPVHIATFRAWGCNAVPIGGAEIYNALQQGVADGQDNPWVNDWDFKFYEVQKYGSATQHFYTPAVMIISKKTWDKLPADIQKYIMDLRPEISRASREFNERTDQEAIAKLKGAGMQIIENVDKESFMKTVQGVYDDISDPVIKDMVKQIKEMK